MVLPRRAQRVHPTYACSGSLRHPSGRQDRLAASQRHQGQAYRPPDDDFTGLIPIGKAIGDARMVLLGEAMHGDGAAFLAKTRRIKFRHQRKRFDVIVWGAGSS